MKDPRFFVELFTYSILTFLIFLALERPFYRFFKDNEFVQKIRENAVDGKKAKLFRALHIKKQGTPTMAGVMIWLSVLIVVLLSRFLSFFGFIDQSLLQRGEVYLPLFTLVAVGILGAVDDWWNIKEIGKKKGIEAGPKFFFLTFFAVLSAIWFYFKLGYTEFNIPLVGTYDIGILMFPLIVFVILAASNAVNITDGLDGLAGGILVQNFAIFGAIAFVNEQFFLAIFCGLIMATLFAFLWFNVPPAKFFMGDTGSLSLGATLAIIASMTGTIAILPLTGFVFVFETLSVIIQLTSKKIFGRKVFLIAPIHHHFEKKGWSEPQIVMRFWIINGFVAVVAFILHLFDKQ
jgi:phospho-N-acetylmuramoyl-pentapeptide-transferase